MWRSLLTLWRQAGERRRVHEASVSAQGTWAHQFRWMTALAVWVEIDGMSARTHSSRRVSQRLHAGQHSRVAWPRALARSHWMLTIRTSSRRFGGETAGGSCCAHSKDKRGTFRREATRARRGGKSSEGPETQERIPHETRRVGRERNKASRG
jgi:hypothetical protein